MTEPFDSASFITSLTHRPGVYRMLDESGTVLYVGKARDLRKRVGSYFGRSPRDAKTHALLQTMSRMDVSVTATEQEALLLEYNLIKEHKPRFNVLLRDDKSYPYVHVTTEQEFPRFEFHRGSRNLPGRFFGPFPNAGAVRESLQQIQRLFRVRQCQDSFFSNRTRPCLQYQIKRCTAPCVGLIDAERYRQDVADAMHFIEGDNDTVLADLVARMERSSESLDFERAAEYRDQIAAVKRVQAQQAISASVDADIDVVAGTEAQGVHCLVLLMIRGGRVLGTRAFFPRTVQGTTAAEVLAAFLTQHYFAQPPPAEIVTGMKVPDADLIAAALAERNGSAVSLRDNVRGNRRRWVEMALQTAKQALATRLSQTASRRDQLEALAAALGLAEPPARIECFDISHTAGGETVASCVVFGEEGPKKAEYRRFNIRDVAAGDDYAAIGQVVSRRYARVQAGQAPLPDLIIVDGGRGQLTRARDVLQELQLGDIPLAGIAKGLDRVPGRESIYLQGRAEPLAIAPESPAMHLLQQVRDEAHRFAITGHRGRRSRVQRTSSLEAIPGLGPRRRRALLQQFGGLQGIARAGIEDLVRVNGISRALAERIYLRLHEDATSKS
jgi:excinuclease ABC subunit C